GLLHLALETTDVRRRLSFEKSDQIFDDGPMLIGIHAADARGRTFADIPQKARPADLARTVEYTFGTTTNREHPEQLVERFANRPRMGIGPEISNAAPFRPAHHQNARILLVQGDCQVRIGLVVAVADV